MEALTTTTVDEPLPTAAAPAATAIAVTVDSTRTPLVLAEGAFISHEHTTTGTAKLVRLSDGSQVHGLRTWTPATARSWWFCSVTPP